MNHRLDPLHSHAKPPKPLYLQFKWTIVAIIALGTISALLFAQHDALAWWYTSACIIITILVFTGEVFRK